jgi:hypothetical protein
MQFGTVNNAGADRTELISSGASPDPTHPSTLLITNPGPWSRGIQVGPFPAEALNPQIGVLSSGFSAGVMSRASTTQRGSFGVVAEGRSGVDGESSSSATAGDAGVIGTSIGRNSNGVIGIANNGDDARGVFGQSRDGFAGFFSGNVRVTGKLVKSGIFFQIDHPLDPQNKYLLHSGVESPDMKNVYDGIAQLDEDGSAWIALPEWFEELNRDYRYQLTALGGPAPDLHIAEEIAENRFRIAGGATGMSVSWQKTGFRKDAWAERNRIVVEEDKPEEARGTYLHPEAFGQPETRGEGYAREEALRLRRRAELSVAEPPEGAEEPEDST